MLEGYRVMNEPFPSGDSHAGGEFGGWDEVVAVDVCESLPPFSQGAW